MGDNADLAWEQNVAQAELAHFLDVDVPEAQRRATLFVEEAVLNFRGVRMERGEKGGPTLVNASAMVFLETEERSLVASLRLTECHVRDFDLNVRLPKYNKGQALSFSLMAKSPYLLRQLQDAVHHAEQAASALADLADAHRPDTGVPPPLGAPDDGVDAARRVMRICDKALTSLCASRREMGDWQPRVLPLLPQGALRMYPPLPADLLLQAFVDGPAVCLRLAHVAVHHKAPPGKPRAGAGDSCHNLRGRCAPYKGNFLEFLDIAEARAPVKAFAAGLAALDRAHQGVWDLRANAAALLAANAAAGGGAQDAPPAEPAPVLVQSPQLAAAAGPPAGAALILF